MIHPVGQLTRLNSGQVVDALNRLCHKAPVNGVIAWIVNEPIAYPDTHLNHEPPAIAMTATAGDLPPATRVITLNGTITLAGKLPSDTPCGDPSLLPNSAGNIGSHSLEGQTIGDHPPQGQTQRSGKPITAAEQPKPAEK